MSPLAAYRGGGLSHPINNNAMIENEEFYYQSKQNLKNVYPRFEGDMAMPLLTTRDGLVIGNFNIPWDIQVGSVPPLVLKSAYDRWIMMNARVALMEIERPFIMKSNGVAIETIRSYDVSRKHFLDDLTQAQIIHELESPWCDIILVTDHVYLAWVTLRGNPFKLRQPLPMRGQEKDPRILIHADKFLI